MRLTAYGLFMLWTALPITLRQLQYVGAVAETKHFGHAAKQCHVSQPSLSAQVSELEVALGVTLFERNPRGVRITADGAQLLAHARAVLVAAGELVDHARLAGDPMTGVLRLGVIPTIAPYLLPFLDPQLRALYGGLEIRWLEDRTETLVELLLRGELDGALLAAEAELGSLEVESVAEDEFVLAAAPDNPLVQSHGPLNIAQLKGQRLLLLTDGHCLRHQTLNVCHLNGAHEEPEFRATSLATLTQMVAGGMGATLLPEAAIPTETRGRAIALRRFADPRPRRTLAFAWRRGAAAEPTMRTLTAAAKRVLAERASDHRNASLPPHA